MSATITIKDYPCGSGKTTTMINQSIIIETFSSVVMLVSMLSKTNQRQSKQEL